jgi:hypothetical protein
MPSPMDSLSEGIIRLCKLTALLRQTILQFSDKLHEWRRDVTFVFVSILANLVRQSTIFHNFRECVHPDVPNSTLRR